MFRAIECACAMWAVSAYFVIHIPGLSFYSAAIGTSIYFQIRSQARLLHWLFAGLLAMPVLYLAGWGAALPALGAGCAAVSTYRMVHRRVSGLHLLPISVGLCVLMFSARQGFVIRHTPITVDRQMLVIDHHYFYDISTTVWKWAILHHPVYIVMLYAYTTLPCVAIIVLSLLGENKRIALSSGLLLAAFVAVPCYFLCPAVGPAHIADLYAPRNCMPSLHVTWALLLLIWSRDLPRYVQWFLVFYFMLTVLSTLTTGEHYIIDVVAAIPYAFAISYLIIVISTRISNAKTNA